MVGKRLKSSFQRRYSSINLISRVVLKIIIMYQISTQNFNIRTLIKSFVFYLKQKEFFYCTKLRRIQTLNGGKESPLKVHQYEEDSHLLGRIWISSFFMCKIFCFSYLSNLFDRIKITLLNFIIIKPSELCLK